MFLLRAQDQHAVATLRHYADRVQAAGGDPNLVAATRQSITEFAAWPVKKAPDLYAAEVATGAETAAILQAEGVGVGDVIGLEDGNHRITEISQAGVVVEPVETEPSKSDRRKSKSAS